MQRKKCNLQANRVQVTFPGSNCGGPRDGGEETLQFPPNTFQLPREQGTATAIIREVAATGILIIVTIVDLKYVYRKVPWKRGMEAVRGELPKQVHGMIAKRIEPVEIGTRRDDIDIVIKITIGATQGLLCRSTLSKKLWLILQKWL